MNAIVVWNTRYMESALNLIQNLGEPIEEFNVQRLSPLGHEHINIMGRYSFVLPEEIEQGKLRKLIQKTVNRDS